MNTTKRKLSDIADIKLGMHFKTAIKDEGVEGNAYLVRTGDLNNNLQTSSLIQIEVNEDAERFYLKEGDILLRLRGPVFKAYIFEKEIAKPVIVNNQIAVIKVNNNIVEPYYLLWNLNSSKNKKYLESRTEGTNIAKLSRHTLKDMTLDILPIEEQRKIALIQKNWLSQKNIYKQLLQTNEQYFNGICNNIQNSDMS